MQIRFDNINRKSQETNKGKERFYSDEDDNLSETVVPKKKCLHDEYGCINYMPKDYPDGESETTQEGKKSTLKEKHLLGISDQVETLMLDTYFSQRRDIIEKGVAVCDLKVDWPFLFEPAGIYIHFKELTGIKIKDQVESALSTKGK